MSYSAHQYPNFELRFEYLSENKDQITHDPRPDAGVVDALDRQDLAHDNPRDAVPGTDLDRPHQCPYCGAPLLRHE